MAVVADQRFSEDEVRHLCLSPLYIFYIIAAEHLAPEQVTPLQIIRALEYGLKPRGPFDEALFDLLKANLHTVYATFPKAFAAGFQDDFFAELSRADLLLARLPSGDEVRRSLCDFAAFLAAGEIFKGAAATPALQQQVRRVEGVFGLS